MRTLYSSVFAVVTAIASVGAWAQSDPKIKVTMAPELDPNKVTLSRNLDTPDTAFIGQAAYRVKIEMNAANVLNKVLFTATTSVIEAAPSDMVVSGQTAAFDGRIPGATIPLSGENPACAIEPNSTTLTCKFGDEQLAPGDKAEFIILVRAPEAGGRIKVDWGFGGDEGKGNGNGCCTKFGSVDPTELIDSRAVNSTVKHHAQSFAVAVPDASNILFTSQDKGATKEDPWVTIADLGSKFQVAGQLAAKPFVQGIIDELKNTDAGISSCSSSDKNECWKSQVTIQDPTTEVGATWSDGNFLYITLERHSSIIKNGTKLTAYANGFYYSKDGTSFTNIPLCAGLVGFPKAGQPCLEAKDPTKPACVERAVAGSPRTFVWSCTVKAVDNGVYLRR